MNEGKEITELDQTPTLPICSPCFRVVKIPQSDTLISAPKAVGKSVVQVRYHLDRFWFFMNNANKSAYLDLFEPTIRNSATVLYTVRNAPQTTRSDVHKLSSFTRITMILTNPACGNASASSITQPATH